jgi:RimJ/RimL family protein N-acetyltransferase
MSVHTEQVHVRFASDLAERLAQLQIRIAGRLRLGLRFESTRFGLRRDLERPFQRPNAKIPISVRPLVEADLPALLSVDDTMTDPRDRFETAWRRAFAAKRMKGGYVAIDERDGTPCYVQWLFGATDNDFVSKLGGFPKLAPDEALLENAFTPARYRGMGIMSAAMALIAERADDIGARHVLTFVEQNNIASLKGCQRSGFFPDLLHRQVRLGFGVFRRDSFIKLANDDPRRVLKF